MFDVSFKIWTSYNIKVKCFGTWIDDPPDFIVSLLADDLIIE